VRPSTKTRRDLLPTRAKIRSGSGALVTADISEFYHSVYTHSIPWALHTKATAKANRFARPRVMLVGDELDRLIQRGQDNQTMGIPIGPDTSFIVAELVLSACDEELASLCPSLKGLRYFDDYEFAFSQTADAEDVLAKLQEILLGYELRVNPRKTRVQLPPVEFESEWVSEIRSFRFRRSTRAQAGDLISYFDLVTKWMNKLPDEHIAKYAVTRLVNDKFVPFRLNLALYQSLLCQTATAEPGSIREVLQSLIHLSARGNQLDVALISEMLTAIIMRHGPLGHHYEVAWCIWAAISMGITLATSAVDTISTIDNSIVAILALDARQHGLTPGLVTTLWETRMSTAELYEEQWLLAYEANVKGWLPSQGGGDHVMADNNFAFLKSSGVEFYVSAIPLGAVSLALGY
jgi:hypothetical protein